ncbi:RNA polymerase sigma factor, sigma-70 family [Promicromonospora umidemergens]|uniref:HTH luxR-type domain-containing protein n=1 Tax=Promicromonospora umidemergens TaxID=629679 RepID=A0ABP8X4E0_9MICO|nr:sigma-70 family RNA polymerase sigma factor [Promicromonospora umidemergens]MCP2285028.1 RNA polymerase sigma factor, sigma-70 family [Promicromonospora umidemergens]
MAQWETELEELMARRSRALVGYAFTLTRDVPRAEDLVQDALVKVFSRLRRPAETGGGGGKSMHLDQDEPRLTNVEGYVRRAILTIYLDGYRRQSSWTGIKHLLADDAFAPAAERAATARVDVGVALARLSPRQRESVVLRFFEDMTVPQIAQTLGTSPGTIKRHLSNAMELLRTSLAEMNVPEMETSFEDRLGAVSGSVRRRRAVKVGALGGATLVVAGLLAVAALWGPDRLLSEPVPPATPSPGVSNGAVGAGWAPSGWRAKGPQFYCGMEVTELVSSSDTVRLELTGDAELVEGVEDGTGPPDDHLAAPIRITRTGADGLSLDGQFPQLVFAQDGLVVDISGGWNEGGGYVLPDAGESAEAVAEASATTACGQWTTNSALPFETYLDARPAGTYDVYAVLPWSEYSGPSDLTGTSRFAVSGPVTMAVPALEVPEEEPLTVDIRDGYQPPWLEGTNLACGAYASGIPGDWQVPWAGSILELRAEDQLEGAPQDRVTVTFTETEGEAVDTTRTPFTTVWLSDGRVVGVGRDVWSDPVEPLGVDAKGETSVVVSIEPDRTCLKNPDAELPAGGYDVYALAELDPGAGGERELMLTNAVYYAVD